MKTQEFKELDEMDMLLKYIVNEEITENIFLKNPKEDFAYIEDKITGKIKK